MKRFVYVLNAASWAIYLFGFTGGCAGDSAQHAENVQTAATYEGEQALCIDRARTIEESHSCRCGVMVRYGRTCPPGWAADGGTP